MDTNEIITTEAIEEITEAVPTGNTGLKTMAKAGIIGAASITAWELAVKPAFRWVKGKVTERKANRKLQEVAEDLDDMDLDDIPDIE